MCKQAEIGAYSILITDSAMLLLQRIFENIVNQYLPRFSQQNSQEPIVAKRSVQCDSGMTVCFGGKVGHTFQYIVTIHELNIIISCTASTLTILGLGEVGHSMKVRKHKLILIVGLAVPRNVESEVDELDDIFLYTALNFPFITQKYATQQSVIVRAALVLKINITNLHAIGIS
ncbi:hypothetical protein [Candidatus Vallotia cooleyia]|uniref:hypothetical protein n=1 Tax=Candidatus Vallotiella adelgis TaxID=1177211 RepID=UPI001D028887|nr:hypothetical protein [Candidatus Vallotia cooleyia]